jgi:hypothetical protein
MLHQQGNGEKCGLALRVVCALTLGLCLSAGAQARQEQPPPQQDQQQQAQPEQQQQQAQPPDEAQPPAQPPNTPGRPTYAPQDANRPPYAKDHAASPTTYGQAPQGPPPQGQHDPGQYNQGQDQRYQNAPDPGPLPSTLTIAAGTELVVRINEYLSSDRNQVGDRFTAVLMQPLVANGWVVARRGQVITGQVEAAVKAGRIKGVSQLGLELTDATLVDGQQRPILTELWKGSGGTSHGQDAGTIAGGTALGAAIGAAADWGTGAAIGAGAGAAAGIGAVLLTRGRPTVIQPETQLSFKLVDPVKVDTTQGQQAFVPVTPQDFEGGRGENRPRLAGGYAGPGYPGPGYYNCGYDQPCYAPGYAYAYPYPYVGFYPGYWWGPGFYGGGYYGGHFYGGFGRGFRR